MRKLGLLLIVLMFVASSPTTVNADGIDYPGAKLFSYQCYANGITFLLKGNTLFQASFAQISGPLAAALAGQQNQPIIQSNPASLWALKSNELQIHLNADPDGTKLVINTGVCGQVYVGPANLPGFSGQAVAFVRVTGMGQAVAYARITATGQIVVYVQVSGTGIAFASAQVNNPVLPTYSGSGGVYIVQPGDTLFSIARRYNTTVSVLMRLNHLANANVIVIGQAIRLP